MAIDVTSKVDGLVEYYKNTLIVQYRNKTKALSTIELFVREIIEKTQALKLDCLLDIDLQEGKQLDNISAIVGVDRFYTNTFVDTSNYIGWVDDLDWDSTGSILYTTDAGADTTTGVYLTEDNFSSNYALNDLDFIVLIKLKIVKNGLSLYSIPNIQDLLLEFFGNEVIVDDGVSRIFYIINQDNINLNIINSAIEKKVLPKPMGVGLNVFVKDSDEKFLAFLGGGKTQYSFYEGGFNESIYLQGV